MHSELVRLGDREHVAIILSGRQTNLPPISPLPPSTWTRSEWRSADVEAGVTCDTDVDVAVAVQQQEAFVASASSAVMLPAVFVALLVGVMRRWHRHASAVECRRRSWRRLWHCTSMSWHSCSCTRYSWLRCRAALPHVVAHVDVDDGYRCLGSQGELVQTKN